MSKQHPKLCASHDLELLIPTYVAPGVVYLACDKCPWWEPAPPSDIKVTVVAR